MGNTTPPESKTLADENRENLLDSSGYDSEFSGYLVYFKVEFVDGSFFITIGSSTAGLRHSVSKMQTSIANLYVSNSSPYQWEVL